MIQSCTVGCINARLCGELPDAGAGDVRTSVRSWSRKDTGRERRASSTYDPHWQDGGRVFDSRRCLQLFIN